MTTTPARPFWARAFASVEDANDYWHLVTEVAIYRWGPDITLDHHAGSITINETEVVLNISNIAADAVGYDTTTRRQGLYNFFSRADETRPDALRKEIGVFSRVRDSLRVRMWPERSGSDLVARPLTRDAVWAVVLDHSFGAIPVTHELLGDWGHAESEVWARARRNTREIEVQRTDAEYDGISFSVVSGGLFTSGVSQQLERHVPEIGHLGAMVAAPTSHLMLVHPLRSRHDAWLASLALVNAALPVHMTEPNPLSASVFWYRIPDGLSPAIDFIPGGRPSVEAPPPLAGWYNMVDDLGHDAAPPAA